MAGGQSMATSTSSSTTRTGTTSSCFTSTSMATPGPASAPVTRPDGPPWSGNSCSKAAERNHNWRTRLRPWLPTNEGDEYRMKAIAVFPGQSDTVHLADLKKPSVNDVPNGRGVLVRILKVGVDGTDKE